MKTKWEPIKNQKFDIGRTINFAKCDCEKCDYMHCPKNNYCVKMKQSKYTIEEFVVDSKDAIKAKGGVHAYLRDDECLMNFMDACIGGFPKGTYWNPTGYSIELVSQNRSKYGPDFNERADIEFDSSNTFPIRYYCGCTDAQENFAKRLQKKFIKLAKIYAEEDKTSIL